MTDDAIKLRWGAMHAARKFLLAQRRYSAARRRRAGVSQAREALHLAYGNYEVALNNLLNHLTSDGSKAGEAEIELLKAESAALRAGPWAMIARSGRARQTPPKK